MRILVIGTGITDAVVLAQLIEQGHTVEFEEVKKQLQGYAMKVDIPAKVEAQIKPYYYDKKSKGEKKRQRSEWNSRIKGYHK